MGVLFGSISYLNLLPFQVYLKRHLKSSAAKMGFRYKRAVPSKINRALQRRQVHAAFISSVASKNTSCTDLGIIANKHVYSVLLIPGQAQRDPASATSNQLAKVLGLEGRVLIGDAALKYYLEGKPGIDMAQAWHERTGLPFVFARLCYNQHGKHIQKMAKRFVHTRTRIPQYMLKKESKQRGITPKQLSWYLDHIYYEMDWKAKRGLKKFLRVAGSG